VGSWRRFLGLALSCVLFAITIQAVSLTPSLGLVRCLALGREDPFGCSTDRGRLRVRPEESATAPATYAAFEPELDDTSPSRRRAAHIRRAGASDRSKGRRRRRHPPRARVAEVSAPHHDRRVPQPQLRRLRIQAGQDEGGTSRRLIALVTVSLMKQLWQQEPGLPASMQRKPW